MGKLVISIIFILVFFVGKSIQVNEVIRLCKNGGIEFQDSCICPYAFSGEDCEIRNSTEKCTGAKDWFDFSSVCCWSKYRTEIGLKEQVVSNPSLVLPIDQHYKIKQLLNEYGPWDDNDLTFLKYIIDIDNDSNKNEKLYSLKYTHTLSQDLLNGLNSSTILPNNNYGGDQYHPLSFILMIHKIDMESIQYLLNFI